jgi:hypothetical protein
MTLIPRSTGSSTSRPDAFFATRPPGSALPSGAQCATLVRRQAWEPRPQNATANQTVGVPYSSWSQSGTEPGGYEVATAHTQRIDGNFTGTTDEIIQWGACKWGIDEDVLRAMAVRESYWVQGASGDDYKDGCGPRSWGLMQSKSRYAPPGCAGKVDPWWYVWPHPLKSTAFNVDYAAAIIRSNYEGLGYLPSLRGDFWGAVAHHYSGDGWNNGGGNYVAGVKGILANKPWLNDPAFYNAYVSAGAWPSK